MEDCRREEKRVLEEGVDDLKQQTRAMAESRRTIRVGETLWNRYEIVEWLGKGKSGEVWRCRDLEAGAVTAPRRGPGGMCFSKGRALTPSGRRR